MEPFHVLDVLIEVRHDQAGFMTGDQGGTDVAGKQDAGERVVERKVA